MPSSSMACFHAEWMVSIRVTMSGWRSKSASSFTTSRSRQSFEDSIANSFRRSSFSSSAGSETPRRVSGRAGLDQNRRPGHAAPARALAVSAFPQRLGAIDPQVEDHLASLAGPNLS